MLTAFADGTPKMKAISQEEQELTVTKEATLRTPALHCGGCAKTVKRILEALPGVEVTHTDPEAKVVGVQFDESAISLDQVQEALAEVGFSPDD